MALVVGVALQAVAHLWDEQPEVAAGIYAAGAIAAIVPQYAPAFNQTNWSRVAAQSFANDDKTTASSTTKKPYSTNSDVTSGPPTADSHYFFQHAFFSRTSKSILEITLSSKQSSRSLKTSSPSSTQTSISSSQPSRSSIQPSNSIIVIRKVPMGKTPLVTPGAQTEAFTRPRLDYLHNLRHAIMNTFSVFWALILSGMNPIMLKLLESKEAFEMWILPAKLALSNFCSIFVSSNTSDKPFLSQGQANLFLKRSDYIDTSRAYLTAIFHNIRDQVSARPCMWRQYILVAVTCVVTSFCFHAIKNSWDRKVELWLTVPILFLFINIVWFTRHPQCVNYIQDYATIPETAALTMLFQLVWNAYPFDSVRLVERFAKGRPDLGSSTQPWNHWRLPFRPMTIVEYCWQNITWCMDSIHDAFNVGEKYDSLDREGDRKHQLLDLTELELFDARIDAIIKRSKELENTEEFGTKENPLHMTELTITPSAAFTTETSENSDNDYYSHDGRLQYHTVEPLPLHEQGIGLGISFSPVTKSPSSSNSSRASPRSDAPKPDTGNTTPKPLHVRKISKTELSPVSERSDVLPSYPDNVESPSIGQEPEQEWQLEEENPKPSFFTSQEPGSSDEEWPPLVEEPAATHEKESKLTVHGDLNARSQKDEIYASPDGLDFVLASGSEKHEKLMRDQIGNEFNSHTMDTADFSLGSGGAGTASPDGQTTNLMPDHPPPVSTIFPTSQRDSASLPARTYTELSPSVYSHQLFDEPESIESSQSVAPSKVASNNQDRDHDGDIDIQMWIDEFEEGTSSTPIAEDVAIPNDTTAPQPAQPNFPSRSINRLDDADMSDIVDQTGAEYGNNETMDVDPSPEPSPHTSWAMNEFGGFFPGAQERDQLDTSMHVEERLADTTGSPQSMDGISQGDNEPNDSVANTPLDDFQPAMDLDVTEKGDHEQGYQNGWLQNSGFDEISDEIFAKDEPIATDAPSLPEADPRPEDESADDLYDGDGDDEVGEDDDREYQDREYDDREHEDAEYEDGQYEHRQYEDREEDEEVREDREADSIDESEASDEDKNSTSSDGNYTLVRPREPKIQLQNGKIIDNPDFWHSKKKGVKKVETLYGPEMLWRTVVMEAYETYGEDSKEFEDAQSSIPWFSATYQGNTELSSWDERSSEESDASSDLSNPPDDSAMDATAAEIAVDEINEEIRKNSRSQLMPQIHSDSDSDTDNTNVRFKFAARMSKEIRESDAESEDESESAPNDTNVPQTPSVDINASPIANRKISMPRTRRASGMSGDTSCPMPPPTPSPSIAQRSNSSLGQLPEEFTSDTATTADSVPAFHNNPGPSHNKKGSRNRARKGRRSKR